MKTRLFVSLLAGVAHGYGVGPSTMFISINLIKKKRWQIFIYNYLFSHFEKVSAATDTKINGVAGLRA
jgi:hypothetical protein